MIEPDIKRTLGALHVLPFARNIACNFSSLEGDAELRSTYTRDDEPFCSGIKFRVVRSYRYRAEGHSTAWYSDGAYETLAEVDNSTWIADLKGAQSHEWPDWPIRHFLIYIEDFGAYEVAAKSFEWIPEEPI